MKRPDVFAYLGYRKFLRDAFGAIKARHPKTSFRSFAKEAGYAVPNFLQFVIGGKRDLGQSHLTGTIRALGLNKQEADFFTSLVGFDQAKKFEDKNFHYQRMIRSRRFLATKPVEAGQLEYFDQWYHPVVRELLIHKDFAGDLAWITERVHPPVTSVQVEKSVDLLERLGLIRRDGQSGRWIQTENAIGTPTEVGEIAISNYHRTLIKLGLDSIEAFPPEERDIRSVTLGIPKSKLVVLRQKVEDFWREIGVLVEPSESVEEVIQVNFQVFPMTQSKRKRDG